MSQSPTSPAGSATGSATLSPTEVEDKTPSVDSDDEPTCFPAKVEGETPTLIPPAVWTFVEPPDLAPELHTPASPSAVHSHCVQPEPGRAPATPTFPTGTTDADTSRGPAISTTAPADLPPPDDHVPEVTLSGGAPISTTGPADIPRPDDHVPEVTLSGATLGFAAPPTTPITPRSTAAMPSGYTIRPPRPSFGPTPLPYVRAPRPSQASSSHGRFGLPTTMRPSVAPSTALGSATLPIARPIRPVAGPRASGARPRAVDPRTTRPKLVPQNEFERHIRRQRDRKNERELDRKRRRAAERNLFG